MKRPLRHERQSFGLLFRFSFDDGHLGDRLLIDLDMRHSDLRSRRHRSISPNTISRTDDRRDVGQQMAAAEHVHRLQMRERWRADLALVRLVRSIGDEIHTECCGPKLIVKLRRPASAMANSRLLRWWVPSAVRRPRAPRVDQLRKARPRLGSFLKPLQLDLALAPKCAAPHLRPLKLSVRLHSVERV
jgi:hypothetical protein